MYYEFSIYFYYLIYFLPVTLGYPSTIRKATYETPQCMVCHSFSLPHFHLVFPVLQEKNHIPFSSDPFLYCLSYSNICSISRPITQILISSEQWAYIKYIGIFVCSESLLWPRFEHLGTSFGYFQGPGSTNKCRKNFKLITICISKTLVVS